jgi:hypothetical protein
MARTSYTDSVLTCADFPTWKPVFGRDEETGEDHGTEAEFNSDCDRLAEQVQALIPGSCASWGVTDDGVTYLVHWDERPGVADDAGNRETDDPEVEAAFFFNDLEDVISSLRKMTDSTTRERALFLERMAD